MKSFRDRARHLIPAARSQAASGGRFVRMMTNDDNTPATVDGAVIIFHEKVALYPIAPTPLPKGP